MERSTHPHDHPLSGSALAWLALAAEVGKELEKSVGEKKKKKKEKEKKRRRRRKRKRIREKERPAERRKYQV